MLQLGLKALQYCHHPGFVATQHPGMDCCSADRGGLVVGLATEQANGARSGDTTCHIDGCVTPCWTSDSVRARSGVGPVGQLEQSLIGVRAQPSLHQRPRPQRPRQVLGAPPLHTHPLVRALEVHRHAGVGCGRAVRGGEGVYPVGGIGDGPPHGANKGEYGDEPQHPGLSPLPVGRIRQEHASMHQGHQHHPEGGPGGALAVEDHAHAGGEGGDRQGQPRSGEGPARGGLGHSHSKHPHGQVDRLQHPEHHHPHGQAVTVSADPGLELVIHPVAWVPHPVVGGK
mmetsp:Transcript_10054/g.25608  ORF Transcript_10054/g.25608 Transcript_10054/m.25608 type:complete len:285 (-) Transcript_10054:457-1311(-)